MCKHEGVRVMYVGGGTECLFSKHEGVRVMYVCGGYRVSV